MDQLSPLSTHLSQLHLRAPAPTMEDLQAQASLSKDSPWGPWLPEVLGCLGPPLTLQRQEGCTPDPAVPMVSLAEGRGEGTFLRFLYLGALSVGICFVLLEGLNGVLPSHTRSFAVGDRCPQGPWTALSESLPRGVPRAE